MARIKIAKSKTNEMIKKLTGKSIDEVVELMINDIKNENGKRFRNCNVRVYGNTFVSYATPVAIRISDNIIELGCYSTTTSKQVTKWCDEVGGHIYRFDYIMDEISNLI